LEAAGGRVLAPDGQPLAYGKPGFLNGPFVAMGG
jgi:3'(2'), 5'-bisphosphate nucleotidase